MGDQWVALIRGINVGGHHRVPMAELRTALGAAGLRDVRTHIQSGNVLFRVDDATDEHTLATTIADTIESTFGFRVPVVVRPFDEIVDLAGAHPDDGGDVPPNWLMVLVCDGPLSQAADPDPARYEPDTWSLGDQAVFVTYPDGSSRSKLTIDVFERAFGVTATARNLNTMRKIVELGRRDAS